MRQLFSKTGLRHLSLIVAIVLLFASVPATAGFILVLGPTQPELTINICQPIQTFDRVPSTLLARPATDVPEFVFVELGSTAVTETARLVDYRVAPDTPPPKTPDISVI
jgi:hypothetical protein